MATYKAIEHGTRCYRNFEMVWKVPKGMKAEMYFSEVDHAAYCDAMVAVLRLEARH